MLKSSCRVLWRPGSLEACGAATRFGTSNQAITGLHSITEVDTIYSKYVVLWPKYEVIQLVAAEVWLIWGTAKPCREMPFARHIPS
jgi:hypothetical protein